MKHGDRVRHRINGDVGTAVMVSHGELGVYADLTGMCDDLDDAYHVMEAIWASNKPPPDFAVIVDWDAVYTVGRSPHLPETTFEVIAVPKTEDMVGYADHWEGVAE